MKKFISLSMIALLSVMVTLLYTGGAAWGHERRTFDKYQLTVGFLVEPAIEGQKNGIDLRVANTTATPATPVAGVEKTVQVEITHVPSNTTKVFPIRAIFNDAGHYTNDLILTAPGQFKFRFFGNIEGVTLNETFTSGPGTFGDSQSSTDMQFPQQLPQMREVSSAVTGARDTAQEAKNSAGSASTLGMVGTILGAIGIIVGGAALVASRKKSA